MSVEAISAVLTHSGSKGTARSVLTALANRADENGLAWPAVKYLAGAANCSPRSVQYSLRSLEEAGELVVKVGREGGRRVTPLYWIALPGLSGEVDEDHPYFDRQRGAKLASFHSKKGAKPAPIEPERVQTSHEKGATHGQERVQQFAPDTSVDMSRENAAAAAPASDLDPPPTDQEQHLTDSLLRAFNVEANGIYSLATWGDRIVACLRAHPDLSEIDHLRVVRTAFASQWWKRTDRSRHATPGVIWGSLKQFEHCVGESRQQDTDQPEVDFDANAKTVSA